MPWLKVDHALRRVRKYGVRKRLIRVNYRKICALRSVVIISPDMSPQKLQLQFEESQVF